MFYRLTGFSFVFILESSSRPDKNFFFDIKSWGRTDHHFRRLKTSAKTSVYILQFISFTILEEQHEFKETITTIKLNVIELFSTFPSLCFVRIRQPWTLYGSLTIKRHNGCMELTKQVTNDNSAGRERSIIVYLFSAGSSLHKATTLWFRVWIHTRGRSRV